jgi:hypothetical protein
MRSRDELSPEDQQRVDEVTTSGIHAVERKPFRPLFMVLMLLAVTTLLSGIAILLARLTIP